MYTSNYIKGNIPNVRDKRVYIHNHNTPVETL